MRAGDRVDQLPGNADPIAAFAHRAFEHIAHAKLMPDLLRIGRLALVRETRIAGDDEQPADARERGNDLLYHAIGEILLLRVAAHICERQHRDRRLIGKRQRRLTGRRWALGGDAGVANPVDPHRPGDVLYLLFAHVFEGEIELVTYLIAHDPADADPARLGERFEGRPGMSPVAE